MSILITSLAGLGTALALVQLIRLRNSYRASLLPVRVKVLPNPRRPSDP